MTTAARNKTLAARLERLEKAALTLHDLRVELMVVDQAPRGTVGDDDYGLLEDAIYDAEKEWQIALARAIRMQRPEDWAPMYLEIEIITSIERRTRSLSADQSQSWDNAGKLYEAFENGTDLVDDPARDWRPTEMLKRIGLPADYRPTGTRPSASISAHKRIEALARRLEAARGA